MTSLVPYVPMKQSSRAIDYNAVLSANSPTVLLLGMVFAHTALEPKRGQEFRDRVRCQALRNQGFHVYTLDDKHDDSEIEEHCRANFADTRRMITAMKSKWPENPKFHHIVLDYFFSPVKITLFFIFIAPITRHLLFS
jgi:hypothetical protein